MRHRHSRNDSHGDAKRAVDDRRRSDERPHVVHALIHADTRCGVRSYRNVSRPGAKVMRYTLYAKNRCAANIATPAAARPTQYGAAASTDAMNGLPEAQVMPCSVPPTDRNTTYAVTPTVASQKCNPVMSSDGRFPVARGNSA